MNRSSRWQRLATEASNSLSRDLDLLTSGKIVDVMIEDNRSVLAAVQRERAQITRGADLIFSALSAGGRLIFAGAGTSGRLGVLEAAELPPTFGIDPRQARALMAGGPGAVHRAKEGVEDDAAEGRRAMRALRVSPRDVVIGISASGITPFVHGAVACAKSAGAPVVGITCDPRSGLKTLARVPIVLDVGAEVIAGSTRLKAGTATKIVLNILTTTAMVRAGKTYGNLMVDVRPTSAKLRDRARRMVSHVTGFDAAASRSLLARAGGSVKVAILMHEAGISKREAASRLRGEPRLRKLLGGG